jgi:hypothetical protein
VIPRHCPAIGHRPSAIGGRQQFPGLWRSWSEVTNHVFKPVHCSQSAFLAQNAEETKKESTTFQNESELSEMGNWRFSLSVC